VKSTETRFDGVIFDVDGVLVASPHERAWREALDELMATEWRGSVGGSTYQPGAFTTAIYQALVAGKPRMSGALAVLEFFKVPEAALRAVEYADRKQTRLVQLIEAGEFAAFPDGVRFAMHVDRMGLKLVAASSSKNARTLLQMIDLADYGPPTGPDRPTLTLLDLFDADVSGRDLPEGKPNPAIFLLAAAEAGLSPRQCLVVEDAPSGILAARAGGMRSVGVARLNDEALLIDAGADLVVTSLDRVDLDALADGRLVSAGGG